MSERTDMMLPDLACKCGHPQSAHEAIFHLGHIAPVMFVCHRGGCVCSMFEVASAVCDFCASSEVKWDYPAQDFIIQSIVPHGSMGGWAACPVCHGLIQKGERDQLALRSAKRLARRHDLPLRGVLVGVRRIQDDFWAHREGAPEPVEVT